MIFYGLLRLHPILIAAAVIPAIVLMVYIYRKDRLEKEPTGLLVLLIVMGILSTSLASFLEQIGAKILAKLLDPSTELFAILSNLLVIGLVEEGSKYFFLKRRTWRNPNFNCKFDGLVYAVFVSLGFALWENIFYVFMYGLGGAMLRAVTAVPGHACFGVFMGALYGQAKLLENRGDLQRSKNYRVLAVLCPTVLHGLYDYIATSGAESLTGYFIAYVIVMFLTSFVLIRRLSKEDRFI